METDETSSPTLRPSCCGDEAADARPHAIADRERASRRRHGETSPRVHTRRASNSPASCRRGGSLRSCRRPRSARPHRRWDSLESRPTSAAAIVAGAFFEVKHRIEHELQLRAARPEHGIEAAGDAGEGAIRFLLDHPHGHQQAARERDGDGRNERRDQMLAQALAGR